MRSMDEPNSATWLCAENMSEPGSFGGEPTGTRAIDLGGLFPQDITSSESFDIRGVESSGLAQLLHALPLPALLVDPSHVITFANAACGRGIEDPTKLHGVKFSRLFPRSEENAEAGCLMDKVLEDRSSCIGHFLLTITRKRMWGRMHFRSLRFGKERAALILVEDLPPEKRQLLVKEQHQAELQKAHDRLEERVREHVRRIWSKPISF